MKIKTLKEQYEILKKYFPEHKFEEPKELPKLPEGAEGWFLIPTLRGTYQEALQKVLDAIKEDRGDNFVSYPDISKIEGYIQNNLVLDCPRAGDFFVYPAQTGERYRRKSVKEVRDNLPKNEFLLNSYEVGCILLSHSERLSKCENLWIDCAGDKYTGGDGGFSHAPCFYFYDGLVRFGMGWVDSADSYYGSASAFLSKIDDRGLDTFDALSVESRLKDLEEKVDNLWRWRENH
jgi:hypothetical protein